MNRTSHVLVPFALCATGLFVLCFSGCGKQEEASPVDPASPQAYMKDKAFRQTLKDRRKVAQGIGLERGAVTERQDKMIADMGKKLQTDDRAKIVEALASDAEWKALEAKGRELDEAFMKHHQGTMRVVRERITPKGKKTSK